MSSAQKVILLGLVAVLTAAVTPFIGMSRIPLSAVLDPGGASLESTIFWDIRMPRTCAAFLAGAAL
ncbi:MAG: iron chelate uptake ABC transporter family permease subunit, partial [Candidatus Hydrogenedentes bacterium]|nr:iron chelate uptake ABC transporter family permease subunit [Candidatus Hydrogenedentota bacterium]